MAGLLRGLREAFAREQLVGNLVWLAIGLILSATLRAFVRLPWPYFVVLAFGIFLLGVAAMVSARRRKGLRSPGIQSAGALPLREPSSFRVTYAIDNTWVRLTLRNEGPTAEFEASVIEVRGFPSLQESPPWP